MKTILLVVMIVMFTGCTYFGSRGPKDIVYTASVHNSDGSTCSQQTLQLHGQEAWLREQTTTATLTKDGATFVNGESSKNDVSFWDILWSGLAGFFVAGSTGQ